MSKSLESRPSLAGLNQILVPESDSGVSKKDIGQLSAGLNEWGLNFSLPVVCLTDEEDVYQLLTGLPIYQAAVNSDIEKIWVFLVAQKREEAEKAIEQAVLQTKFNEDIIDFEEIKSFVEFINTKAVPELIKISGIKEKYAQMIVDKRPYSSPEDLKKLGLKRSMNWLRAYRRLA